VQSSPAASTGPRPQRDIGIVPRISVVMAVYNGERYLSEAIESILGQTFTSFEFLIIDDDSTDRTREIIRSYEDPRIYLVENQQNQGVTPSLNCGLRLARGEFIVRQDADDISETERFAKQIAFMDANPDVALLGTQFTGIDGDGTKWKGWPIPTSHDEIRWRLLFGTPLIHTSVMLRREPVLRHIGFYNEELVKGQDFEYWHRITEQLRAHSLKEPLVRYRIHRERVSDNKAIRDTMPRVRAAIHARMLGWGSSAKEENELRSEVLTGLLRGWGDSFETLLLERAVADLLQLHTAYRREQQLSPSEATKHRLALRTALAGQLILIAANRLVQQPQEALRLFRSALRMRSPVAGRVLFKALGRISTSLGLRVYLLDRRKRVV
jgi:glycosyltransferase involved in cell wall biosynthesis